jgi:hypothetical protein
MSFRVSAFVPYFPNFDNNLFKIEKRLEKPIEKIEKRFEKPIEKIEKRFEKPIEKIEKEPEKPKIPDYFNGITDIEKIIEILKSQLNRDRYSISEYEKKSKGKEDAIEKKCFLLNPKIKIKNKFTTHAVFPCKTKIDSIIICADLTDSCLFVLVDKKTETILSETDVKNKGITTIIWQDIPNNFGNISIFEIRAKITEDLKGVNEILAIEIVSQ